jgi:hypothetical protein
MKVCLRVDSKFLLSSKLPLLPNIHSLTWAKDEMPNINLFQTCVRTIGVSVKLELFDTRQPKGVGILRS